MTGLEARIARAVAPRVAAAVERVRSAVGEVSGVVVEEVEGGIVASGRRLKARWLDDARLRWLGGWM